MTIIQNVYMIIFKIFGLAPFSLKHRVLKKTSLVQNGKENSEKPIIIINYSVFGCLYNILLIAIVFGTSFIILPNVYDKPVMRSTILRRIELALEFLCTITVIIIWLCYCIKQSTVVSMVNDLISLDRTMSQLSEIYHYENNHYFLHLLFVIYIISGFSILVIYHVLYGITIVIIVAINDFIVGFHILQYALTLAIIKKRFRAMYCALIKIIDNHSEYQMRLLVHTAKPHGKTIHQSIISLRRGHRLLANICMRVSMLYGTSILCSITYHSGIIVYYLYLVIIPFVNGTVNKISLIEILNPLMLFISSIIVIIAICVYANGVVDDMTLIVDGINKLINVRMASREVKWELEQFALEMLHRKVKFNACGIFFIDCTLLRSIASMTVTYLILLVQLP